MPVCGRMVERSPSLLIPSADSCPLLEQKLDDSFVPVYGRTVECRLALLIPCIDLHPVFEQQLEDSFCTIPWTSIRLSMSFRTSSSFTIASCPITTAAPNG